MADVSAAHKMIVREVGEPYGPLDTQDFEDYEIEHLPECKSHVDEYDSVEYDCAIGFQARECGTRWSLRYAGTEVTVPGEYMICAWAETIRGYDYTEYDGGLYVVTAE